jgi:hypothetical protein
LYDKIIGPFTIRKDLFLAVLVDLEGFEPSAWQAKVGKLRAIRLQLDQMPGGVFNSF